MSPSAKRPVADRSAPRQGAAAGGAIDPAPGNAQSLGDVVGISQAFGHTPVHGRAPERATLPGLRCMTKGAGPRNWSENGPTEAPGQRDCATDRGAEVADFQGLDDAAEWSRTITSR